MFKFNNSFKYFVCVSRVLRRAIKGVVAPGPAELICEGQHCWLVPNLRVPKIIFQIFVPIIINSHEIFRKAKEVKIRFTSFIPINSQKDIVKLVGEKERLN